MAIELNHTIVPVLDKEASATFCRSVDEPKRLPRPFASVSGLDPASKPSCGQFAE
jgi:hypothetical protein